MSTAPSVQSLGTHVLLDRGGQLLLFTRKGGNAASMGVLSKYSTGKAYPEKRESSHEQGAALWDPTCPVPAAQGAQNSPTQ